MSPGKLPTFFVIGASKAGTTALHRYLDLHPKIEMSEPKEPHVMLGPGVRGRLARYEPMFAGSTTLRGESSTGYSVHPHQPHVAANIASVVPDARLVYMVRDPVERTIVHYAQAVTVGRETRPIDEAIDPYDHDNYFVAASRYWHQVQVYLEHFAPEALLVVDSAELRSRREETIADVLAHVGADPSFRSARFEQEHNTRGVDNVPMPRAGRALRGSRAAALYRRALPLEARRWLSPRLARYLGGREVRPRPQPELLAALAETLAPEAEALRSFSGQRFAGWSV